MSSIFSYLRHLWCSLRRIWHCYISRIWHTQTPSSIIITILCLAGFILSLFGITFTYFMPPFCDVSQSCAVRLGHAVLWCGARSPAPLSLALFSFSHANIFHLLANLIFLWRFKPRFSTTIVAFIVTIVTALICTHINYAIIYDPPFGIDLHAIYPSPTCGLSVFLFAAVSRRYVSWHQSILPVILSNLTLLLINLIFSTTYFSVTSHLISFFLAYFIWQIFYHKKRG